MNDDWRPWKFYTLAFAGAFFGGYVNFLLLMDFNLYDSVSLFVGVFLVSMTIWVMMDTFKQYLEERIG